MKYVVMLGDRAWRTAPSPSSAAGPRSKRAVKPHMDFLAQHGTVGMARTVPEGMPPGSDTANLSVMGYDPRIYYSGRSPLEAVSMGIPLAADDVTFRCNLVNLSEEGALEDATMVDYSSDEITTAESTELIAFLNREFHTETRGLYPGISYRHCLVLRHAETGTDWHAAARHLLKARAGLPSEGPLRRTAARHDEAVPMRCCATSGQPGARFPPPAPANCCWFWGEGTRPRALLL